VLWRLQGSGFLLRLKSWDEIESNKLEGMKSGVAANVQMNPGVLSRWDWDSGDSGGVWIRVAREHAQGEGYLRGSSGYDQGMNRDPLSSVV
jgi:hypothetical protein